MDVRTKIIERAKTGLRESKNLDFKSSFNIHEASDWCEIIKDIVAISNSGGGAIVFGLNNDGSSTHTNNSHLLDIDPADITNKIEKYTGYNFSDFELLDIERNGVKEVALIILGCPIPMVFKSPGTYAVSGGKQKTAFSQGTLYFRHGAKSEPANMDDIREWRDREIEKVREELLGGIRQVVEAPQGYVVQVAPREISLDENTVKAKITNSPDAMPLRPQDTEHIWPHKQKELLIKINSQLPNGVKINGHDVLCLRREHDITPEKYPGFIFKAHRDSSPQYSDSFIDWILEGYLKDNHFFEKARGNYRMSK